ncbi:hypothetical protein PMAYCL1PPCAC_03321 [Pristionchus mayeri]|uniref:G protein-coupled receptor n=1 Tax=Pristionchus mayeri TaxID=1317129 RepID=A0AAN5C9G2_9BILA|nr:hypothetical protein PMAYCL1PPCAC_03321 [Pristionchus mayeri]
MAVLGAISVVISCILIYFIARKTPLASRQYRLGLIVLQMCFLIFDVHWCFLFVPLLSLPYFGIYCTGLLCTTVKVDVHAHMTLMLFVTIETFVWFFVCMMQRHQAVVPLASNLRCSTMTLNRIIYVLSTLIAAAGPIGFSTCRLTAKEIEWTLEMYLMRWLESKPQYLVYSIPLRPQTQIYVGIFLITMVFFSIACISLMVHTMHVVRRSMLNSGKSKDIKNAAMRNLFIQFAVFACSLLFPGFLLVFNVWVPFDVEIFVLCQVLFAAHSLASSLVALLINSNYRRYLQCWKKSKATTTVVVSSRKTTATVLTVNGLSKAID